MARRRRTPTPEPPPPQIDRAEVRGLIAELAQMRTDGRGAWMTSPHRRLWELGGFAAYHLFFEEHFTNSRFNWRPPPATAAQIDRWTDGFISDCRPPVLDDAVDDLAERRRLKEARDSC